MSTPALRSRLQEDVKTAMKARDRERLGVLRMIQAELMQVEVDERTTLDEPRILAVLDKMVKQRKDSLAQFEQAGRDDLVAKERHELEIIQGYLPAPLSGAEIDALLEQAIAETGASSPKEMGKVMAWLKEPLAGRADLGAVSQRARQRLQE